MSFSINFFFEDLEKLPKSFFSGVINGYIELDIDGVKITNRKTQKSSAYYDYLIPLMEKMLLKIPDISDYNYWNKEIYVDFGAIQGRIIIVPIDKEHIKIRITGLKGEKNDDSEVHEFEGDGKFYEIYTYDFFSQVIKSSEELKELIIQYNPIQKDRDWLENFDKLIHRSKNYLKGKIL